MSTGKVQDCGCIALTEELQVRSGLYPGAPFQIDFAADGTGILIHSVQQSEQEQPSLGAACQTPSNHF